MSKKLLWKSRHCQRCFFPSCLYCMHFICTSTTQQFCDDFCLPALTWSALVSLQIAESVTWLSGSVPSAVAFPSSLRLPDRLMFRIRVTKGIEFTRATARGESQTVSLGPTHTIQFKAASSDGCESFVCSKPENVSLVRVQKHHPSSFTFDAG